MSSSKGLDSRESGSVQTSTTPSQDKLQHEEMEYDRRQIRRKLREKLEQRGQSDGDDATWIDLEHDMEQDDVTVYDDAEVFPWKQREAAVQAAAVGGKTEGRMEGVDSLERALMAHTHNIQYGRGKGFAWSRQKRDSKSSAPSPAHVMSLGRELTDWESFKKLQSTASSDSLTSTDPSSREMSSNFIPKKKKRSLTHEQQDVQRTKQQRRHHRLLNTLYITIAIGLLLGFAYYIESIKTQSFKTEMPAEYAAREAEEDAKNRAETGDVSSV